MTDCFSFRFKEKAEDKCSLVIFVHGGPGSNALKDLVKADVEENLSPEYLYIIGINIEELKNSLLSDALFLEEVGSWVSDIEKRLKFLNVSNNGSILELDSGAAYDYADQLMQAGVGDIFVRRKGLITSSESYHFAKPSGAHCDKFIRTSNLFTSGLETTFLAIGILEFLTPNIKRVYVDTSSISFLLSVALQLSNNFGSKLPTIESFGSYDNVGDFDFVEDDDTLVFISATTSNGLKKELLAKKNFKTEQIITLLYSGVKSEVNNVFDISQRLEGGIYSVKPNDCRLCKKGSKVIDISGEQFLPATPKHETLLIRKPDFHSQRQKFFKEFATKNILKCSVSPDGILAQEHFYIDVEQVLKVKDKVFQTDLERQIKKYLTRDTERLIVLDSSASFTLANKINEVSECSLPVQVLKDLHEDDLKDASSVMVVASSITSGRKLLSAARKLRGISETAAITYFVAFSKISSKEQFEQLRKDLTQGGFELVVLRQCPMPRSREEEVSVWDIETEKLQNEAGVGFGVRRELPHELAKRLKLLTEEGRGDDDLFLLSPTGKQLNLRPTFVFWIGLDLDTNKATQADVYWTIQSLIHDLRARTGKGLATSYHTTLISPVCFDRFNDGVIQACILRAAKPVELNYAVDEIYSRQITDIILSCISNVDNDQGEGTLEFLMAIWLERLSLKPQHMKELIALESKVDNELVRFFLTKFREVS